MSTRKPRHDGNKQRGYADLNKSHGHNGFMESETLYIACKAVTSGAFDTAIDVLVAHYGSLRAAKASLRSIDDSISHRYVELLAVVEDECQ